jgi:hypothetical protein
LHLAVKTEGFTKTLEIGSLDTWSVFILKF